MIEIVFSSATRRSSPIVGRAAVLASVFLSFAFFSTAVMAANAQEPEKISVQLCYRHQFQFAGFYAAIEQGYYREVGLDVILRESSLVGSSIDDVLLGNAQYGQTESDLLFYRLHGKPLVALAPIFQHSPSALMALKESGIRSPHELKGRRLMLKQGDYSANFIAMLIQEGVGLEDIDAVDQDYGVEELIDGHVDAVSVYQSDRPFLLKQAGIEYNIIEPLSYGIDFYGDTLYTTEDEIEQHPERAQRFVEATLRGWQYALEHSEEIIDLLIDRYGVTKSREHLRFEAREIRKLIMPELIEIGHTNPQRWQRMADIFVEQGRVPRTASLDGFIYRSQKPWYGRFPLRHIATFLAVIALPLLGAIYFWRLSRNLKHEIRARKLAETDNQRLGDILEHSLNEIYIFDSETLHFIQVNEGARNNLGYSMEELKRLTPLDLKPEYNAQKFNRLTRLLKSGLGQVVFETVHQRKDGSLYPVEVNLQLHEDDEQPVFYAVINDISERKSNEQKISRLNHLYLTLSQVNQAIAKIDNENELFRSICRITVDFGCLQLAWIGKKSGDNRIVPLVSAGGREDFVKNLDIKLSLDDGGIAQSSIEQAYSTGNIVACNGCTSDSAEEPECGPMPEENWCSSCAVPILRRGETYAVLVVYTTEPNYFDQETIQLFDEMKEDLSFALDSYDREIARRKAEENLKLSAKVFQQSQDAILICDQSNKIISVNPAFTHITGYEEIDAKGKDPAFLSSGRHDLEFYRNMWESIEENSYWQGEIWNRRKSGELFPEWLTISAVRDDNDKITNYIAIFSDITLHKESEQRIEHLAHYDPVTDLPNRILLRAHVDHELVVSERQGKTFALLFLDLDHFKNINDSLGHTVGDQVLVKIAQRLKRVLREEDTVARLGGDEFNILLSEADFKGAALVADKIIKMIARPIPVDHFQLHVTASVGISLYPENGSDYETLSKNADTALYQSKRKGRNQFAFFTDEMQKATMRRMEIEHDLRLALSRNELEVHYQPQIDTFSGEIIGAEALLRWLHPRWGDVSPSEFIPVAEECGLILAIGDWVLDQAVGEAARLQRAGSALTFAVNLSMAQFKENVLYRTVKNTLERHGLQPQYLELELTESIAMQNARAALEITRQLRALGVQLSIDDFGTGYSSLSYLKAFSLDKLKIDRSFTANMVSNKDNEVIVDTIIGLAKSLGLKTIAEGVESEKQWRMLRQKKCDQLQGFYLSKPLTADELAALVEDGKRYQMNA